MQRTRSGGLAGIRPSGDAWARVRREMSDVAGKTSGQIQRWWLSRAAALLRYHARQGLSLHALVLSWSWPPAEAPPRRFWCR